MTKLFVANCTSQDHVFMYTIGESASQRRQDIPAGQQRQIAGDLNPVEVDQIVRHHSRYGMIAAVEVGRAQGKHDLIYSLDRMITMPRLLQQVQHNQATLREEGREARRRAAVQSNNYVEDALRRNGVSERVTMGHGIDLTVEEESRDERTNHTPYVGEGVIVSRSRVSTEAAVPMTERDKAQQRDASRTGSTRTRRRQRAGA